MSVVRNPMTLFMLAVFAVMVAIASTYPPDARFMPYVVGIPAILLCLLQLALDARSRGGAEPADTRSELEKAEERVSRMTGRHMEFEAAHEAPAIQVSENSDDVSKRREFVIWLYVLGFIAGILFFGFWISIPVFIAVFLAREAGYTPVKAAIYAIVGGALLYAIFTWGLKLELHNGFIIEALKELRG